VGWKLSSRMNKTDKIVLSENQCGMETPQGATETGRLLFVEREPMWDDRSGCEWCVVSSEW